MSFFLTGSGTGVGKTTSAALLLKCYPQLLYWKPVQTGTELDRETAAQMAGLELDSKALLLESYHFQRPLSPHRAAELENKTVDPNKILADFAKHQKKGPLLIEGAGGLLVPLNRKYTWLDFLKDTKLAVVIAAQTGLGTINHSLLTAKVLRQHKIHILGFIFCGPSNSDNCRTVADFSQAPVLCSFDYEKQKDLSQIECLNFAIE